MNGQLVEVFSSDRTAPLSYLRPGWNVVTIKTTPQTGAANSNGLRFSIGPVEPGTRRGGVIMKPVLWEFRNDTDWSLSNGEFRHRLGPAVKEIALSFSLYFAGLQHEGAGTCSRETTFSRAKLNRSLNTAPVTATGIRQQHASEHVQRRVPARRVVITSAAPCGSQRDQARFAPSRRRRAGQRRRVGARPS